MTLPMPQEPTRYYIGLMSGTSMDGIDAALVAIRNNTPPELIATHDEVMPDALRRSLLELCHADQTSFAQLAEAETAFCELQGKAVRKVLSKANMKSEHITAIGSHGQTIEHAPYGHGEGPPYTLQLDNPSLLAELTHCTVVADFRRRDLAAGGQAAPLAPAFHQAVFAADEKHHLVLNLGGFANITWLAPRDSDIAPLGFDTGPANALMDAWHAYHHPGERFDKDGTWAASGKLDETLLERLLSEPFFHRPPPRSTGREVFNMDWLTTHLSGHEAPQDVQATLAELTAASVALGVEMAREELAAPPAAALIVCGGGAHNTHLLARLGRRMPETALVESADWGWPADWIEAGAFAWLAHQRLAQLPGNLPSVTGAKGLRVLGGIYSA
ncbi:anhydro-N-acetylmuramic acid kinase [Halomonas sp. ZH2S]|uniref:Anhydro-N-acetylmuramic acid kinase n=2 Tax=Vreelandella zhuhanensis TaxID=2684210 RepID=A0A7X3H1E0_9GAMM|nr:anhydro-N-acetylmuramic acid kinase [Halomonas zhuhanensis]